jgi:hypothetical protein
MPLMTQEKSERFHARSLLENSTAFFALTVCSKTNHEEDLRQRRVVAGD